jgi:hypothetical protein
LEAQLEDIVMGAFTVVGELAHDDHKISDDELEEEDLGGIEGGLAEEDNCGDPQELETAIEELYHGAKSSVLAATILIMTLCTVHGVSNKFADIIIANPSLLVFFACHTMSSNIVGVRNIRLSLELGESV